MKIGFLILILLILIQGGRAQSFVNLDFESATVTPAYPPSTAIIYANSAIPGWTAYNSGSAQTVIAFDTFSLGGSAVVLEDSNAPSGNGPGGFGLLPIQGNYSVLLQGPQPGIETSAAIGQTGTIPITAQSLTFWGNQNNGNLQVSFNGQNISYGAIGNGVNYIIYGANIASFAGQTGQLLFTTPVQTGALLDNIQFSNSPIPEPSATALGALGAFLIGFRLWKH